MNKYLVSCDMCSRAVDALYNGEHYLAPDTWRELYTIHGDCTGEHLCDECIAKFVNNKEKIKKPVKR